MENTPPCFPGHASEQCQAYVYKKAYQIKGDEYSMTLKNKPIYKYKNNNE